MNSFKVIYDADQDKYYRINKVTGQIVPCFKSGKLPPKFDSNVTGASFVARKNKYLTGFDSIIQNPIKQSQQQQNEINQSNQKKNNFNKNAQAKQSLINLTSSKTEPIVYNKQPKTKLSTSLLKKTAQYAKNSNSMKNQYHTISILPQIKKQTSLSIIQPNNMNPAQNTISRHSVRNSQGNNHNYNQSSFALSRIRQDNQKDNTFLNSITKMSINSGENSMFHSRFNQEKFQDKLKRLSQVQQAMMMQSKISIQEQELDKTKLRKIGKHQTSILDQSHFSIKDMSRLNASSLDHNKRNDLVSKLNIKEELISISKQKEGLKQLQKKCKPNPKSLLKAKLSNPSKSIQTHQSNKTLNAIQQSQQLKKASSQISKQKSTFLSFYPEYIFKQNPRLIQQQKDRKINFKKLERLFLEINQRKFGKIYQSNANDDAQPSNQA